jgi:hypothetical protein
VRRFETTFETDVGAFVSAETFRWTREVETERQPTQNSAVAQRSTHAPPGCENNFTAANGHTSASQATILSRRKKERGIHAASAHVCKRTFKRHKRRASLATSPCPGFCESDAIAAFENPDFLISKLSIRIASCGFAARR